MSRSPTQEQGEDEVFSSKDETEEDSAEAENSESTITYHRQSAEDLKKWTLWAAASYAFVMLIIGLPLWWKTTTVQRVPLPYDQMLTLHEFFLEKLEISVPIHIKGFSLSFDELSKLNQVYQAKGSQNTRFDYKLTQMTNDEINTISNSKTLEEIDVKLCASTMLNDDYESDLHLYYVGRSDLIQSIGNNGNNKVKIILGNCKSIYYLSDSSKLKMEDVWKVLVQFAIPPITGDSSDGMNANEFQLPLSAGYDILWSLLIPEPELVDVTWNIEAGVKDFIQPLLQKLHTIGDFTLRSQTLYYVRLNVKPKLNTKSNEYEIPYEQLPLVINPVESKLISFVSQNPALNFLIYITPCDVSPMYILNEEGQTFNGSNSFFVPRWGGIQVYNVPCPSNGKLKNANGKHEVSMKQIMAVVISQFRSLIGVQEMVEGTNILNFHGSALRDWEVDLIMRKRLASLLFTASNTLKSLGNLLDQITNIVVRDQVGQEVEKSVKSLKDGFEAATKGKLKLAQIYALEAFKSSEIAFHHPSNLAQLYFPDDQKYAIYIPLFLPVGIPVLLSLRLILTEFWTRYTNSKIIKSKLE